MIVYDLLCDCGYQFEGWFQSGDDFLKQQKDGGFQCPECGGSEIRKILSPVAGRSTSAAPLDDPDGNGGGDLEQAAAKILKDLQNFVVKEYDDVGTKLARESLEMKYGLKEPRNIRGVTTPEEEKLLKKEGIELLKIPLPGKKDKSAN